ncbi:MAG: 1-deoxy-D-xylulose-5-phosphate reductoisomerase [Brevinemataceae bacterium]
MKKKIILLGATGSVGESVLSVIRTYPERFELVGISGWTNIEKLVEIIKEFQPQYVSLQHIHEELKLIFPKINIFSGKEGIIKLIQEADYHTAVSAILGTSGLLPAIEVLKQGRDLIIANKEALVIGGTFLKELQQNRGGQIIPLDSEHLALFDLLRGKNPEEIQELVITASGGPFLNREIDASIEISEVLNHPTWKMGMHITVGSALMINKGLEVIEAMRLFDLPESKIRVLVHPQSKVHAAINTKGGHWHFLASPADMRYPALYSLFHPEIPMETPFGEFNPVDQALEFFDPDYSKFPLLALARQVAREDGTMPAVLCGSIDIAIEQFLAGNIKFYKIPELIREIIDQFTNNPKPDIEEILIIDNQARIKTLERITFHGDDLR